MKARTAFRTAAILLFILFSCRPPSAGEGAPSYGSLSLALSSLDLSDATIVPDMDTVMAGYDISGSGPEGATFLARSADTNVSVDRLAPGEWNIATTARNAAGDALAEGEGSVAVQSGITSTASIALCTFAGSGTLNLTVLWDAGTLADPAVAGWLIPLRGRSLTLPFTLANDGTATCRLDGLRSGFYVLLVKLSNRGIFARGAVSLVWIVPRRVSAGTIDFRSHNPTAGTITVNLSLETADPLTVEMTGQAGELPLGQSMSVSANTADTPDNVVYVWYVNGESVGTGGTIDVGGGLPAGVYRLDVTGFTADGRRAGSATAMFRVANGP